MSVFNDNVEVNQGAEADKGDFLGAAYSIFNRDGRSWGDVGATILDPGNFLGFRKKKPPPPDPDYLGANRNSKKYAQEVEAALLNRNYDFWLANYFPLAEELAGQVENPNYLNKQIGMARKDVQDQAGLAQSERQRRLASFGLTPTAQEQATFDKGDKLRAAAADVTAINSTTSRVRDRDYQLMSGARAPQLKRPSGG